MSNDESIENKDPVEPEGPDDSGSERVTLSQDTALAFAAEGLIDAYEIARDRQDANLMLKVSKLWLGMSTVLGSEDGTPHKHSKTKLGFTHHLGMEDDVLESTVDE